MYERRTGHPKFAFRTDARSCACRSGTFSAALSVAWRCWCWELLYLNTCPRNRGRMFSSLPPSGVRHRDASGGSSTTSRSSTDRLERHRRRSAASGMLGESCWCCLPRPTSGAESHWVLVPSPLARVFIHLDRSPESRSTCRLHRAGRRSHRTPRSLARSTTLTSKVLVIETHP